MNIRSLMPFVFHVFYKKVRHEHPAKAQWNKNIRSETDGSYNQDVIFVVSQPMNFSKSRKEVFSFSVEKINA